MTEKRLIWVILRVLFASLFIIIGVWIGIRQRPLGVPEPFAVTQVFDQLALSSWQDRPLIINFWATWCVPCVKEMPVFEALHAHLMKDSMTNVQIIGVAMDTKENVDRFVKKYNITYPILPMSLNAPDILRALGNANGAIPFTVLVDSSRRIRQVYLGEVDFDVLQKDLASL